jgi:uncharacterized protein (DUF427 family)
MGLSWQQGPLGAAPAGRFLTAAPLPERLLFAEPLRRRLRIRFGDEWIADSEDVVLLHEPGHHPVAFFPTTDIRSDVLSAETRITKHRELGDTSWFTVTAGGRSAAHTAWSYADLPGHAALLRDRVAFAWRAMDAFFEEDERIVGHAADPYHRIDIRQTSRHLVVTDGDRVVADTTRPVVLYESGFAPRWYVPRADSVASALITADGQTFCPYKGLASYYDVGERAGAAWAYPEAWPEVERIADYVSFEPDRIDVRIDGKQLTLEAGQTVIAHGIDRGLDPDEILNRKAALT